MSRASFESSSTHEILFFCHRRPSFNSFSMTDAGDRIEGTRPASITASSREHVGAHNRPWEWRRNWGVHPFGRTYDTRSNTKVRGYIKVAKRWPTFGSAAPDPPQVGVYPFSLVHPGSIFKPKACGQNCRFYWQTITRWSVRDCALCCPWKKT